MVGGMISVMSEKQNDGEFAEIAEIPIHVMNTHTNAPSMFRYIGTISLPWKGKRWEGS